MVYTTPHHLREYLMGACLGINHAYRTWCEDREEDDQRQFLTATREIDLCARLATYFGTTCHLNAQGRKAPDLVNDRPAFEVQVKYLVRKRSNWPQTRKDWVWLQSAPGDGGDKALILFWPSTSLYKFTNCLSVTKSHGKQYSQLDFAPFVPYATVEVPPKGIHQRLTFKTPDRRPLELPGSFGVRVDIVGLQEHPIWAVIYTRLMPDELKALKEDEKIKITDAPMTVKSV